MLELTEEDALQRLRAQDPAALSWLIGRYNRYVASIVCAVLGARCRPQVAEELTADVFYSAAGIPGRGGKKPREGFSAQTGAH